MKRVGLARDFVYPLSTSLWTLSRIASYQEPLFGFIKIIGTIRSERGRYILETIMTAIETWKARGQNPHNEMQKILRNS